LDFLLLEKMYFEDQDKFLQSHPGMSWVFVGFEKEGGGWHRLFTNIERRGKFRFKWDVKFWDKAYGPQLDMRVENERRKWFSIELTPEQFNDLDFLFECSNFTYEILPNGNILATAITQKSGRLRTSSNNSIAHCWILFYHYLRVTLEKGEIPSYEHCMKVFSFIALYSDDDVGSTNNPEYFTEDVLRATYQLFGMDIHEYELTEDMEKLDFLGARNVKWNGFWCPLYNRERMLFALLHLAGRISDEERCSRVRGLAHNLAFSTLDARLLVDAQQYLASLGRWTGPPLDEGHLRTAYLPSPEKRSKAFRQVKPVIGFPESAGVQVRLNVPAEMDICDPPVEELYAIKQSADLQREGNKFSIRNSLDKMQRSTRKATLNSLVSSGALSPEGKSWLIEALDPYHDEQITLTGYPDNNVSGSVIQCVKQTMSFGVPPTVASGNWDCHITMFNSELKNAGAGQNWDSNIFSNPGALSLKASPSIFTYAPEGVYAYSGTAGVQLYGGNDASAYRSGGLFVTDGSTNTYLEGNCRVIAKGFEVINTTADIYKQGTVSVYRQPTPAPLSKVTTGYTNATSLESECDSDCSRDKKRKSLKGEDEGVGALPTTLGFASTYNIQQPPKDLASLMLLAGSQQFKAADGVYVVATMNTLDNPAKQLEAAVCAAWTDSIGVGNNGVAVVKPAVSNFSATSTALAPSGCVHISPFNMCGAYFTGLSQQTTLTVNAIWYVERFPTPIESDLVVLASPSPGFDPVALEIYQRALAHLPVGVMQGENPIGEWFNAVLKAVKNYGVPIGRAIGTVVPMVNPITSVVESAVDSMRPHAKQMAKRDRRTRRKKQAKAQGIKLAPKAKKQKIPGPGSSGVGGQ
jgi:hypothetical protein